MFYVPKAIKAIFLSALIGTISVQQSHQFPWGFQLKCTSPFLFYIYSPACDQGKGRVRIQMGGRGRPKDQVGGGSVRHCLAEMGGKGYLEETLVPEVTTTAKQTAAGVPLVFALGGPQKRAQEWLNSQEGFTDCRD